MHIDNLFPLGKLAGPDDVVDRESFIGLLTHEILSGQSVMIAGPRRIGKSSVAYEVLRRLDQAGCLTVDLDLFFVSTLDEFAVKLMQKVGVHRWGPMQLVERTWQGLLDAIQKITLRHQFGELEINLPLQRDADPETILTAAFDMAEAIAAHHGKRFVFLFDEFQEVERLGGSDLVRKLRSIFQRQLHCTHLFLGSKPSMLKTLFANRRQAFYRFAVQYDLPPVPHDAWRRYLVSKLASVGMEITQTALDMMLQETGGHPYGVMQVANAVYVRAGLSGLHQVNAELVAVVLHGILERLRATYEEQWAEITGSKHTAEIAVAIAVGSKPYTTGLEASQVTRAINTLLRMAIVERTGRGEYRFVEPLFARWLRENALS